MAKFTAYGIARVGVGMVIEIDDDTLEGMTKDDIKDLVLDKAYDEFGGMTNYLGNGGIDKLIGVTGSNESLEPTDDVDFTEVYED